ncbi:MAG: hypothetical protein DI535_13945 [Citrobacter freundii]|nr:MAG: hypothetical protein DI535_13945 [Citrobacter freundii]
MKLNIAIDFRNTYPVENISTDFSVFKFTSFDISGRPVVLHVNILESCNPFLPGVFNLSFGPLGDDNEINDLAVIKHQDSSKVYSTVLLGVLSFLDINRDRFVGVDGANLTRAYLYYKLFQLNHDYLCEYFDVFGVKYYIRLLKAKEKDDLFVLDYDDLGASPVKIPKHLSVKWESIFNCFILRLTSNNDFLT